MRRYVFVFVALVLCHPLFAREDELGSLRHTPHAAFFDLPTNWSLADPTGMPEECHLCARKKGPGRVTPNANLSSEPYSGTTAEYAACVKERHANYYARTVNDIKCRDLGAIPTLAGQATLLHLDVSSILGDVSILQALLVRDGTAYTLTAGVSKETFGQASSDFLQIIRSLTINPSAFEMLTEEEKLSLDAATTALHQKWRESYKQSDLFATTPESLFHSSPFQQSSWLPFCDQVHSRFSQLGEHWQNALLQEIKSGLIESQHPDSAATF